MNLRLFDNTNTTVSPGLSDEMKTYYSDYLIDNATARLVHDQFGQKLPIPKGKGKKIEFRKYNPFPKATTVLTEGVTPTGRSLTVDTVEATLSQYGDYVELSDMLELTAIDNNVVQATKLLGNQAGETLDTVTREVLNGGTNVQYGAESVSGRHLLVGGAPEGNHYFSVDCVLRAVRKLKAMKAERIDGYYVGIIHPDVAYDLMSDSRWEAVKSYADPKDWYDGEIGRIGGVRFVETTEAKIFTADDLTAGSRNLTVKSFANKVVTVEETLTDKDAQALIGRKILIGSEKFSVASASANTITLTTAPVSDMPEAGDIVYPGEAGAMGRPVYSTLILGDNAYGVSYLEGGGLRHIVKQLGSSGTADPLDQRATVGWKAIKTAARLVEAFMVRVETASTYASSAN
ncbi:MAG: N4-gp56 family major capsid protein [Clostridia bacterium]|nr:N4-gp56 family major capsid protein [Clostridia bacterium]